MGQVVINTAAHRFVQVDTTQSIGRSPYDVYRTGADLPFGRLHLKRDSVEFELALPTMAPPSQAEVDDFIAQLVTIRKAKLRKSMLGLG